jgi:arginine deiminase
VFRQNLQKVSGAKVLTVRDILKQQPISQMISFLINFSNIMFSIPPRMPERNIQEKLKDEFVDFSLSQLSKDHLIALILFNPNLTLEGDNTGTTFDYGHIHLQPLDNLLFTRDQQIVASKGIILGRFSPIQRSTENRLMKAVWKQLGAPLIGEIEYPGTLEGGDFIPVNQKCCYLGTPFRINYSAARHLMSQDLLGTDRMILVEDQNDFSQQRLHLDTFFNVINENLCVVVNEIAQDNP